MASMSVSINLAGAFNRLSLSSLSSTFLTGDGGSFCGTAKTKLSISCPQKFPLTIEAAHKKGAGSTKNGRDSKGQRLGVKIFGDQVAKPGAIIIRQRGTKVHPGNNVGLGKDHTIFSLIDGLVKFEKYGPDRKKVSVYPREVQPENPNSFKVRRREFFRMKRETKKAKIARREAALLAWKDGTYVAPPQLVLASAADPAEENPNC